MMKYSLVIAIMIASFFGCTPTGPTRIAASKSAKTNNPPEIKTADIKTESAIKTETPEVTSGHETFIAKCGHCHELKTTTDHTAKDWVDIVEKMAVKAKLDNTEKSNVLAYVQFYAKTGG